MSTENATVILDVGHGNAAVVRGTSGTVVIDTGPGTSLLEHLLEEKITTIDIVLLSHADADHVQGMLALLCTDDISVACVYANTDSEKGSDLWDDLAWELSMRQRKGEISFETSLNVARDVIDLGDAKISVLAPSTYLSAKGPGSVDRAGAPLSSNSCSAVLKVTTAAGVRLLFAGDLDAVGLDDIEGHGRDIEADVLVFPHHGGLAGGSDIEAFAEKLVGLVRPQSIVFSHGRGHKPNNPRPEVVDAVRRAASSAKIACTQMSMRCINGAFAADGRHLLPIYARGREQGHCCAGSMIVRHHVEGPAFTDVHDAHQAYITRVAHAPLCRLKRG